MKTNHSTLLLITLATFALAHTAAASEADVTATRDAVPKIERLALFKNGLGFATATVTLPDARSVRLGQIPVPSYGTFWAGYPERVKVRHLTTAMETLDEPVMVTGMEQLLRLNPGRRVTLHLTGTAGGMPGTIEGEVRAPAVTAAAAEPPNPYFMEARRAPERPPYGYPTPAPSGMLLIKTAHGSVAIAPGSIQRVDFDGADPICVTTNQLKRPAIRLELETPAAGETLAISYLARGITWVPSYRVDLSRDKMARFSAQAQIINEMADLQDARVDLVTGFPNLQFAELPNPVAMSQNLADFLKSLLAGRAEPGDRSHLTQQAMFLNSVAYDNNAPLPSYPLATPGQTAEDLFLYPLPKVSLKKGETASIPLFTADLPYRHLYTWNLPDALEGENPRPRGESRKAEEVWHICRLVNEAKMPLTTAVAEFVKDGQLVGQDTCFYTAIGAEASIRINRAMNVQAEQAEVEIERKRNAANFYGYGYDLVKLTGELKIRNRQEKAIDLEITKELSGEVLEKSAEAKDIQTSKGLKQVNPKHVLTWTLELPAGAERKINYSYQLFIRP